MVAIAGFTIVELLVAVAIIGILAALLIPAITRAKQKAHKTICISNLHQLGIGLQSFVADNNVYPSIIGPTNLGHQGWWALQIQAEVSRTPKPIQEFITKGVWHCPTTPRLIPWDSDKVKDLFCSYGYNAFGVLPAATTNMLGLDSLPAHRTFSSLAGSPPVSALNVAVPAEMMAIGDSIDGGFLFRRWLLEWVNFRDFKRSQFGRASDRHLSSINVLFCDYHVESPKVKFVFEDKSDVALARWNRDHQPHRDVLVR